MNPRIRIKINFLYLLTLCAPLASIASAAEEKQPSFLQICAGRRGLLQECKNGRSAAQVQAIDGLLGLKPMAEYSEKRKLLVRVAQQAKAKATENVTTIEKYIKCLETNPDLFKSSVPKGCDKDSFRRLRQIARDTALNLPLFQRAAVLRNIGAGAGPYKFNRYFTERPAHNLNGTSAEERNAVLADVAKDLPVQVGDELAGPPKGFLGKISTGVAVNEALHLSAAEQLLLDTRAVKLDVLKQVKNLGEVDYSHAYNESSSLDQDWAALWGNQHQQARKALYSKEESGAYLRHIAGVGKFYDSQYESLLGAHRYFLYMPAYTRREDIPKGLATAFETMLKRHAEEAVKTIDEDLATGEGLVSDGLLKYIADEPSVEAVIQEDLAREVYPMSCELAAEFHKSKEKEGQLVGAVMKIGAWTCFIGNIATSGGMIGPCMAFGYVGMAYGAGNTILKYGELQEQATKAYSQLSPKDKKEIEKLIAAHKAHNLSTALFVLDSVAGQLGISFGDFLGKLNIGGMVSQATQALSLGGGLPKTFMDQLLTDFIHSQIFKARNESLKSMAVGEGTELGAMADSYARSQQIREQLVSRLDFKSSSFDKEAFCSAVKNTLASSTELTDEARKTVTKGAEKYGCRL